jgi:cytochrome P450
MNYALQRNEKVYNTGSSQDKHPLSEFWADRFLVPSPQDKAKPPPTGAGMKGVSSREFSLRGLEGSWLPYGGGANMCPGRQYAKQEMILTAALLLGNYDIELIGTPADINVHYYGTGTFGVKGKQQARIRRRRV